MPLTRRWFFAAFAALTTTGVGAYAWWRGSRLGPGTIAALEQRVLVAVIDAIVPADRDPGAVAAGVPEALRTNFAREPWREREYRHVALAVTAAAEARHGRRFETLELEARTAILDGMLRDKTAGDARTYLAILRVAVLRQFYASPAGQQLLGYKPPRSGYPDYHRPPN